MSPLPCTKQPPQRGPTLHRGSSSPAASLGCPLFPYPSGKELKGASVQDCQEPYDVNVHGEQSPSQCHAELAVHAARLWSSHVSR